VHLTVLQIWRMRSADLRAVHGREICSHGAVNGCRVHRPLLRLQLAKPQGEMPLAAARATGLISTAIVQHRSNDQMVAHGNLMARCLDIQTHPILGRTHRSAAHTAGQDAVVTCVFFGALASLLGCAASSAAKCALSASLMRMLDSESTLWSFATCTEQCAWSCGPCACTGVGWSGGMSARVQEAVKPRIGLCEKNHCQRNDEAKL